MNLIFKQGETKLYTKTVSENDIAAFESGKVHSVYSTFALTRDAEWSGRLFVLEMKTEEEEGIGTFIEVQHQSPAFVGDTVVFTTTFEYIKDNGEIITSYIATVNERIIAKGKQGQRILPKEKIQKIFDSFKKTD